MSDSRVSCPPKSSKKSWRKKKGSNTSYLYFEKKVFRFDGILNFTPFPIRKFENSFVIFYHVRKAHLNTLVIAFQWKIHCCLVEFWRTKIFCRASNSSASTITFECHRFDGFECFVQVQFSKKSGKSFFDKCSCVKIKARFALSLRKILLSLCSQTFDSVLRYTFFFWRSHEKSVASLGKLRPRECSRMTHENTECTHTLEEKKKAKNMIPFYFYINPCSREARKKILSTFYGISHTRHESRLLWITDTCECTKARLMVYLFSSAIIKILLLSETVVYVSNCRYKFWIFNYLI